MTRILGVLIDAVMLVKRVSLGACLAERLLGAQIATIVMPTKVGIQWLEFIMY